MRKHFGDDYFSFWLGGVKIIAINSCLIKDATDAQQPAANQNVWIKGQLTSPETREARHVLVLQHHPWFLKQADEPNQYFNIELARRTPMLEALKRANVTAVFAGHYHRNAYGKDGELEMVINGPIGKPLGKDPSGLRVVKVFADRIEHAYYPLDHAPETIELPAR